MGYNSLAEMFFKTAEQHSDKTGMMYKAGGDWRNLTYAQMAEEVRLLASGLASIGLAENGRASILAENSQHWAFADFAILATGAVSVPIYPTLLEKQVVYIANDSESSVAFVGDAAQFAKFEAQMDAVKTVERYILFDPEGVSHPKAMAYADLLEAGKAYLAENPDWLEKRMSGVQRDHLATFIYTSGTTGEPKGVMLTHGNFLSNIEAGLRALPVSSADTMLSFLPLSHVFERMVGHFLANHVGIAIAYAESIEKVPDNLQEIRPTIMASVPRLFEKIYAKVLAGVEEGSPLKQKIFHWAVGVGQAVTQYRMKNQPLPGGLKFKAGLANKLVFSKLQARVGGNIRFFVSGGAPLPSEIGEFFTAAGLLILEGYGLTETSPVITVNRLDKFKFGTVGIALDNVEVKIAEDGEILTRGPHVMKGYYNKPEETKEAIDGDGWFHTGDIGIFDEDGMLKITDRKKNIIVTAGGKNVAPQRIENLLVTSRYVEQVLVIGDKRKFCSALIVPSVEAVEKLAREKGIQTTDPAELCRAPEVIQAIQQEVDAVNKECASYESIKKFVLVPEPFSIESGELTPSLKIKRKIVEQNYKQEIESMYA